MDTETKRVVTEQVLEDPTTGQRSAVNTTRVIDRAESPLAEYVWYAAGLVDTILVLRLIFLALGAAKTGVAAFLYKVSGPLVAPFTGIFRSPSSETGYLDSAAVLAVIIYTLIAWGIVSLMDVARRNRA